MTTLANERSAEWGDVELPPGLEAGPGVRRRRATRVIRQRLADCFIKNEIARYLGFRIQTALSSGMSTPETSVAKLLFAQLAKETAELTLSRPGSQGHAGRRTRTGRWLLAAAVPERAVAPDRGGER